MIDFIKQVTETDKNKDTLRCRKGKEQTAKQNTQK